MTGNDECIADFLCQVNAQLKKLGALIVGQDSPPIFKCDGDNIAHVRVVISNRTCAPAANGVVRYAYSMFEFVLDDLNRLKPDGTSPLVRETVHTIVDLILDQQ